MLFPENAPICPLPARCSVWGCVPRWGWSCWGPVHLWAINAGGKEVSSLLQDLPQLCRGQRRCPGSEKDVPGKGGRRPAVLGAACRAAFPGRVWGWGSVAAHSDGQGAPLGAWASVRFPVFVPEVCERSCPCPVGQSCCSLGV